jgi:hypothetical protein
VTELSDAYRLKLGDQDVLVTYLLEVRIVLGGVLAVPCTRNPL